MVKDTKAEVRPIATEPYEQQKTDAGIEMIPEYETELLVAEVPEFVSAPPRPGGALRRWTPILVKFASVQVVVQVIGFAAGILVIRNLPKREYALYTLGNTMLAAILVLADSGISSALTAIGGRIWHDRDRLSQLIRTALQLRRWMAMVTLPIVIPVLIWLLRQNGASVSKTAILVAVVLLGCGLELVTRIYAVALRLKSEIRQIQNQALVAAAVKLAIVAIAVYFWFNVEIAIFAVAAGFAVQYWMLRQWHTKHLDAHAPGDPEMRSEILGVVRKQAPHTIYYCLQTQITVWLISIFGNADSVADVGALSRLAVVFSILGALTFEVLFPAFARIQSAPMVRKRYLQIIFAFAGISASVIGVVALFPAQVLAVLGSQYSHLQTEGILMAVSSVLGAIAGLTWGLNASRAWIVPPMKFIPFAFAIQVVLVYFLNLSTVKGVVELSIFSTVPSIAWAVCFALLRINKLETSA
jgi:O-antigen/teichoic acid export membrane protein